MSMSLRDKDNFDSIDIRILENQIANTGRPAYTQSGPIQCIDRKVQWKMFYREQDLCWQSNAQANEALTIGADGKFTKGTVRPFAAYNADILTAHPFIKYENVLGQVGTWDSRSLPKAYMCGESSDMATASRVYEMMKDHPIGVGGVLSFPKMGHPFPISVGRKDAVYSNLLFTTARYPGTKSKASELVEDSFVTWQACDIATYVSNQRQTPLNIFKEESGEVISSASRDTNDGEERECLMKKEVKTIKTKNTKIHFN